MELGSGGKPQCRPTRQKASFQSYMSYENQCLKASLHRIKLLSEKDAEEAKLTEETASLFRQIRRCQKRVEANAQQLETIRSTKKSILDRWKAEISGWVAQDEKVTRELEKAD